MATILEALQAAYQQFQVGNLRSVEEISRQVLRVDSANTTALCYLGLACHGLGMLDEAVASYRQALGLNPTLALVHCNLGNTLRQQGKLHEAEASIRHAVALQPDHPVMYHGLGNVLRELGKLEEGVACFRQALRLQPDYAAAHNGLGVALAAQDKHVEAIACYRESLRWDPSFAEGHNSLGAALLGEGRLEEAVASLRQAAKLDPNFVEARRNLAMVLLLRGEFAEGWREYEWRWRKKPISFQQPKWDGTPLAGRTVLLHAEQGLGDTLHFLRYAALVKQRGGRVMVQCQPSLVCLAASCPGVDQVVAQNAPVPNFDCHASLLSLPGIFGTALDNIPADVPYLSCEKESLEHWRRELSSVSGFKVGIVWQGNPEHKGDRHRSFPLDLFAPLALLSGVRLISLQKGVGSEQLPTMAGRFPVTDLGGPTSADFADTAAVVKNLDLVISADTSVAHLAGALAVPVWVLVPSSPDWRWLLEREDSPWYPTMRLFRQRTAGDWQEVFARVAEALKNKLTA